MSSRLPSSDNPDCAPFSLKITFKDSRGEIIKVVEACEGDDILAIGQEHDIDLEGTSPTPFRASLSSYSRALRRRRLRSLRRLLHLPRYRRPRSLRPHPRSRRRRERHARHGFWPNRHESTGMSGKVDEGAGRDRVHVAERDEEYVRGWSVILLKMHYGAEY